MHSARPHVCPPARTHLQPQPLNELLRAGRPRLVVLVAQHQQRDAPQRGLVQQSQQLSARHLWPRGGARSQTMLQGQ